MAVHSECCDKDMHAADVLLVASQQLQVSMLSRGVWCRCEGLVPRLEQGCLLLLTAATHHSAGLCDPYHAVLRMPSLQ
jgi:hypothetical protein